MSEITLLIPAAAKELLDAIATCEKITEYKNGCYLHPKGKILFKGIVKPGDKKFDGGVWRGSGNGALYLIAYQHPLNSKGAYDLHWFDIDILDVKAEVIKDELPPKTKSLRLPDRKD